jgi:hypothetical protein
VRLLLVGRHYSCFLLLLTIGIVKEFDSSVSSSVWCMVQDDISLEVVISLIHVATN